MYVQGIYDIYLVILLAGYAFVNPLQPGYTYAYVNWAIICLWLFIIGYLFSDNSLRPRDAYMGQ